MSEVKRIISIDGDIDIDIFYKKDKNEVATIKIFKRGSLISTTFLGAITVNKTNKQNICQK